jgi:hypothetical protein
VSIDGSPPAQPPQMSPDGNWVWDGSQWQPVTAVEPTHEGVFAAYAQKVEAADQAVAVAQPAAVATQVQVAPPAVEDPYPAPAPAADYGYAAADPGVPLWQQPKSSAKTVYLYVGGAVVLFLMVLIVLNTINFVSLPFIGRGKSSNTPQASTSPSPSPVSRSEFSRAGLFLNGPFAPALASFNQTLPAWSVCNGESLANNCFTTITATDQQLTNLLSVIDHGAIPPCIAAAVTKLRYDLGVMETGIKLALQGYKNNSLDDLTTGLYHFRRFGAAYQSDIIAVDNAKSSQCSHELEGP